MQRAFPTLINAVHHWLLKCIHLLYLWRTYNDFVVFKHVILAHTAITDVCAKYTYICLSLYTRKRRSVTRVRIANKSQALSVLVAQMLRTVLTIRNTGYSSSMYISSISQILYLKLGPQPCFKVVSRKKLTNTVDYSSLILSMIGQFFTTYDFKARLWTKL